jgi:hypothetical protein
LLSRRNCSSSLHLSSGPASATAPVRMCGPPCSPVRARARRSPRTPASAGDRAPDRPPSTLARWEPAGGLGRPTRWPCPAPRSGSTRLSLRGMFREVGKWTTAALAEPRPVGVDLAANGVALHGRILGVRPFTTRPHLEPPWARGEDQPYQANSPPGRHQDPRFSLGWLARTAITHLEAADLGLWNGPGDPMVGRESLPPLRSGRAGVRSLR